MNILKQREEAYKRVEEAKKMLIVFQMVLYCLLFFVLVKYAVKNSGINCLYFYTDFLY